MMISGVFFLNIWIVGFSVISQLVLELVSTQKILFYYICVGKVLDVDQNDPTEGEPKLFPCIFAFTAIAHFVIVLRIQVYEKKYKFLNLNTTNLENSFNFSAQIVKESLSDLTTTVCNATMYLCSAFFVRFINKIPLEQFNCFPAYLYEYFIRLIWPITFISGLVMLHYYRNGKLRSTLLMELKNYFKI